MMIYLLPELAALCLVMFGLCWLGTGSDEKNAKHISSYPDEVQHIVERDPRLSAMAKRSSVGVTYLANLLTFGVVLFALVFPMRSDSFGRNFLMLSVLGQGLNLFDLTVIDLAWWRNTKRVRFTGTENKAKLYQYPKKHVDAFFRGVSCFALVAILDGWLLTLI